MLNSNATCQIRKVTGFDIYGKPTLGTAVTEKCAVAKLRREQQHTTVRADSGQSRGHADEFVSTNKILLDSKTSAVIGDQITIRTHKIKIDSMHDRYDVGGTIDHFEVTGELWA